MREGPWFSGLQAKCPSNLPNNMGEYDKQYEGDQGDPQHQKPRLVCQWTAACEVVLGNESNNRLAFSLLGVAFHQVRGVTHQDQ